MSIDTGLDLDMTDTVGSELEPTRSGESRGRSELTAAMGGSGTPSCGAIATTISVVPLSASATPTAARTFRWTRLTGVCPRDRALGLHARDRHPVKWL